jgi:hypothetical protein
MMPESQEMPGGRHDLEQTVPPQLVVDKPECVNNMAP